MIAVDMIGTFDPLETLRLKYTLYSHCLTIEQENLHLRRRRTHCVVSRRHHLGDIARKGLHHIHGVAGRLISFAEGRR